MDDETKLIFGFIGSCIITLLSFFLAWRYQENKRYREKKEEIGNRIFLISETMLKYAALASQADLTAKFYYALQKLNNNEFDGENYKMYLKYAESHRIKMSDSAIELTVSLSDLAEYWGNQWDIQAIRKCLLTEGKDIIKYADGIFNAQMSESEINKIYKVELKNINRYIFTESVGKNLIKVQKIVCPSIEIPRESIM